MTHQGLRSRELADRGLLYFQVYRFSGLPSEIKSQHRSDVLTRPAH